MNRLIFRLVLFGALILLIGGMGLLYHLPLDTLNPSPQQPIPFSHQLHAGNYQIDCRYCHRHVERSTAAGVPDVALCRSCHEHIATESPTIKQLAKYWQTGETIPWIRIHQLPDHVYFPHMMHIRAKVACSYCHGEVSTMTQVQRVASLNMGWCLNCHRENQAGIDCWTCHI
ncbi:cytochrome c3 family protein [Malonomonas rubra]|uniref:cytochrome c3 family protein n=1 Tax=Malonomonas rubra TaxID=57040 RepID=UPI0026EABD02|nr:cytochrome c3 family protein [Malonomonas rubra]